MKKIKIDKNTLDFQMRLIKAELKLEKAEEKVQRLQNQTDSQNSHIKYLIESNEQLNIERKALQRMLDQFTNPERG